MTNNGRKHYTQKSVINTNPMTSIYGFT